MNKVLFLFFLLLTACRIQTSDELNSVSTAIPSSYPVAGQLSLYPPPIPDSEDLLAEITPYSGLGAVKGKLSINDHPVVDVNIFLAAIITDSNGEEFIAELDQLSSPRSHTHSNGEFLISNVKPGRYALILDVAVNSFLLEALDSQDPFLITIFPDEILNLGDLDYQDLPIPEHYIKQ